MPSIAQHHSKKSVKMLLLGDSGTGKTASLLSLALAGYKIRILDFDNGLDILSNLTEDLTDAEKAIVAENVHYVTCTDKLKTNTAGFVLPDGTPGGYSKAMKMLNSWKEKDENGETIIDYGNVSTWGDDEILVIDSLTFMGNAAMRLKLFQNGRAGQQPWQSDWGDAQRQVISTLDLLYSDAVSCNIIMTAHIKYQEMQEGEVKGFPDSLGKALPPQIPRYFNTVVQTKIKGTGKSAKREIQIIPDSQIGLKNAAPKSLPASLPHMEGMAQIFKAIRGSNPDGK
jgi:hypothetical protein